MATKAELQAYLAALEKAKYSGVLSFRHGDTQTTFRSMAELDKAINDIKNEINALDGKTRGPRYLRQPNKGGGSC